MGLQTSQVMLLSRSAGETGHWLQRSQQIPLGYFKLPILRKSGMQSTSRLDRHDDRAGIPTNTTLWDVVRSGIRGRSRTERFGEDIWRTASRLATGTGVLAPTGRSSKHSITF